MFKLETLYFQANKKSKRAKALSSDEEEDEDDEEKAKEEMKGFIAVSCLIIFIEERPEKKLIFGHFAAFLIEDDSYMNFKNDLLI